MIPGNPIGLPPSGIFGIVHMGYLSLRIWRSWLQLRTGTGADLGSRALRRGDTGTCHSARAGRSRRIEAGGYGRFALRLRNRAGDPLRQTGGGRLDDYGVSFPNRLPPAEK